MRTLFRAVLLAPPRPSLRRHRPMSAHASAAMRVDQVSRGLQAASSSSAPAPAPAPGPGDPDGHPDALYPLPRLTSSWIDKLIFLGTGTSGQVPAIHCLTHDDPALRDGGAGANVSCAACADVLKHGEASRNRRKCTAAVVVGGKSRSKGKAAEGDDQLTIMIDCGPTFYSSAIYTFPKHNLRRIDAVLLTHAHADAMLGLDMLRAWTLGRAIQRSIDIYLTAETMRVVESTFPYLVDKRHVTGGGGVVSLKWNIIDSKKPFTVGRGDTTVEVTPLSVLHGWANKAPFEFVGYRIAELSYISDCNEIPRATSDLVDGSKVLVIDALKWERHASHYSIAQALQYSLSVDELQLSLFTDLTHMLEHWDLSAQLQTWQDGMRAVAAQAAKPLRGKWWGDYWEEDASETDRELRLAKPAPTAAASADAPPIPVFRVAYDEQAVLFERE